MKASDLIEAIQTAERLFREKTGKPMEIFDLDFSDYDYDGDIRISASADVIYVDGYCNGSKEGKAPGGSIRIHFECEDGKVVDRTVEIDPDDWR